MRLNDCDCGGIPEVTYEIDDHNDYVIGCTVCENKTPMCESLRKAANLWNETYGC